MQKSHLGDLRPFTQSLPCRHTAPLRPRRLKVSAAVRKTSEKHIVCSKTLVAQPEKEGLLLSRCKDIVDFSAGRMRSKSSGIVEFRCSQDVYDRQTFHFWERYDSNVSLGKHNTTPEVQQFMKDVQEYLEGPIGMVLYEWKDGKISNSCIQGGPKGEGGLDDATGATGSAGGASMKQTSSVVDLGKVRRGDEGDSWGMPGFKFPWQKEKGDKSGKGK